MSRLLRSIALAATTAALAALLAGAAWSVAEKGKPAPGFSLKTLDGKTIRLSDYKNKKVVVLSFWATWCPPCKMELPVLQTIWKQYEKKPVQILGINVDNRGDVRATVKEKGLTFPILIDTQRVSDDYGVQAIPTLVIIDKKGIVREIHVGFNPNMEKELPKTLDNLIK